MPAKRPSPRVSIDSDDTFKSEPMSDEARIPMKGALVPEHPRDGRAEASDMSELAQRAVESDEDLDKPLDFEHPSRDARDDADDEDDDEPA